MEMNTIDADFVRKLAQGSTNADRMRKEIDQISAMFLSLIPNTWPTNKNYPFLRFECARSGYDYSSLAWNVTRKYVEKSLFGRQQPSLIIDFNVNTSVMEDMHDCFEKVLYTSTEKCTLPLEELLLVHQHLHVLVAGLVNTFGWDSRLGKKLKLLIDASKM